jgi:hypothetical protein
MRAGNLDRQAAMRVLECGIVGLLTGPVVCALNPCLLSQQYEMLNMRDKNPNTIFEPYDASTVRPTTSIRCNIVDFADASWQVHSCRRARCLVCLSIPCSCPYAGKQKAKARNVTEYTDNIILSRHAGTISLKLISTCTGYMSPCIVYCRMMIVRRTVAIHSVHAD